MTTENPTPNDEQENPAGTALSRLFRQLLLRMNVNESKFSDLMEKYLKKLPGYIDEEQGTAIRANLGAELMGTQMSWKVFCKGLAFLNIDQTTVHIIVTDPDGNQVDASTLFKPKD
ncbi:MAG: hypothetical protein P4L77_11760 [Sulfuriferula sp.]|nr:hypothetical protein [Sulfuriferula sp.]